jgi:hypothetical protein
MDLRSGVLQITTAVGQRPRRGKHQVRAGDRHDVHRQWSRDVERGHPCLHTDAQRPEPRQAGRALRAFTDLGVASVLFTSVARRQWTQLLALL